MTIKELLAARCFQETKRLFGLLQGERASLHVVNYETDVVFFDYL
jgi:hypothetical protein